ncbi:MAG TPA: amidohydrolase family protein [Thermoanaerobaculia bacterium]|nr:amidohydrolase family protein [Thermoanaerobaculia bacterium]
MTPMDAIRSATSRAAEMLDASADMGNITPGAYADLIAVDGDPLRNIHLLHDIPFVMKGGEVVRERRVRALTTK